MALTRGGYPARDLALDVFPLRGRAVGAGAALPTVSTDKDSMLASAARSGVGAYTLTLKAAVFPFKTLQHPSVEIVSVGATPLRADIVGVDAATGVISIQVRNSETGAAAEATADDTIYVRLDVRYSDA